jgi:LPPG:FO 2-phospho-L-lactate transferase
MNPDDLSVMVNTGDDFEHLGLSISPDLDTVMYTLAGLDDPRRGWGRREETWTFMAALACLGGETWFQLGDGDLATHVERTRRLLAGEKLSAITADFCRRLGIAARVLPMTDDRLRTRIETDRGWLTSRIISCARAARRPCAGSPTRAATLARIRRACRTAGPSPARGRDLPFQSSAQHRAHAGGRRRACVPCSLRRSRDRGLAHIAGRAVKGTDGKG